MIPRFIRRALRGEALDVQGDGMQSRDFTFVGDVVQANLLAVKAPNVVGETVNIGCGESHAVMDIVYFLSKFLGREIRWSNGGARKGDVRRAQADIGKARRLLGYAPTHDVRDGLAASLPWYEAQEQRHAAAGVGAVHAAAP